jgi:hypothetical protein
VRFNNHWQVEGKHAFLGASKYAWIRYDLEKMKRIWENKFKSEEGTRKHNLAAFCIKERVRLEDNGSTLSMYVNDAIGFKMTPEQVLFYNDDCFGTADAICFRNGILRIHDLKTGVHPGSFDQIRIYFALFCLEYDVNPYDIEMIGRIYQLDDILEFIAEPSEIQEIMDTIKTFTKEITAMKEVLL